MINREESHHAQELFEKFNQIYWGGSLRRYRVIVSTRYGGQGLCQKETRRIWLTPGLNGSLEKVLLHEMCHAAVTGYHGEKWLAEMLRLAELGAPTREDWEMYQNPARVHGSAQILSEFEELGQECPGLRWSTARHVIGYSYGFVDENGKPECKSAARLLRRARRHFHAGQKDGREFEQAQKQMQTLISAR
jgi:hypothetical protein